MKRTLIVLLLLAAVIPASLLLSKRTPRLPFDGAEATRTGGWQEFGGLWSVQDGALFNRSDELGSKVVAGSTAWADYHLSADMKMLGHRGEVGAVVRVNDMGTGINAYRGYYAGYRSMDNSLILGFSDHDWLETRPVPLPDHLLLSDWLHLDVVAVGCSIGASLTVVRTGETVRSLLEQGSCVPRGKVGLRSLSAGAAWKNVRATAACAEDLQAIRQFVPKPEKAVYPTREDDLARMLMKEPGASDRFFSGSVHGDGMSALLDSLSPALSIASLNTSLQKSVEASLQGTVTHVDPLYIEDASGGIAIRSATPNALNLGDEVEVSGSTRYGGGDVFFEASSIRLLWDDVPVRPVAITSNQAASGHFQGMLVELSGTLLARDTLADGKIRLRLSSGTEEFSVIVQQSLSRQPSEAWETGSMLRVRGVSTPASPGSPPSTLFQILPRTVADVQVVSGPPWTSGPRLAGIIIAGVLLLALAIVAYLRMDRWKMRTIYEERERLAADMHDTLAQGFAGVGYQLQSLRRGMRDMGSIPEPLMRRLDIACDLATDTHREASTRITALHFAADEEYDVLEVLRRAVTLMLRTDSTLEITTERVGSQQSLSLAMRDAIFRIGHEAIANVLRHSRATSLALRLVFCDESVQLEIEDNGVGLIESDSSGFGIATMRARAEELQGTLTIDAAPNGGTLVSVSLPYKNNPRWRKLLRSVRRSLRFECA